VPPIPPHTTFEQTKATAEAMLKGDPDAWDVVKRGVRSKVQEILHG
jgi:pyruvate dehydrogenase (quinone)